MATLRPSALPKLAACPCFESSPFAGEAAERGTRLDTAFRDFMVAYGSLLPGVKEVLMPKDLAPADMIAVRWAVDRCRAMAAGELVSTSEEACRVENIPGLPNGGTCDALCVPMATGWDLKSGQIRNYREQMAAYAYGLMEEHFAMEWTMHLLFCDQREVVTYRFTWEEAREIVEGVVAAATAPERQAEPCEYCDWCALAQTCKARGALAETALELVAIEEVRGLEEIRAEILADPARTVKFLKAWKVAEKELHEPIEQEVKTRLRQDKESVPGAKLSSVKGREFVNPGDVGHYLRELGHGKVLQAYGTLPGAKFRELWEAQMGDQPFPESVVHTGAGHERLNFPKPKAEKKPRTYKPKATQAA